MSISSEFPFRGCTSSFRQPLNAEVREGARELVNRVNAANNVQDLPLHAIIYRGQGVDNVNSVFRWANNPYDEVFGNGFQAWPQGETPDNTYYNLEDHVNSGGVPLVNQRPTPHAFVSTTISRQWHPSVPPGVLRREVWRYEIYAPGGIWVALTLGDRYGSRFRHQDEVAFVAGIAPQYVRVAQLYRLSHPQGSRSTRVQLVSITINMDFDRQFGPPINLVIQRPINDRMEGTTTSLPPPGEPDYPHQDFKRETSDGHHHHVTKRVLEEYYNVESYIDAAFCSSRRNEAYLFMKNEYVKLYYAPRATNDEVLEGPLLISDGFPCLEGTPFGEYGIDCAFGSHAADEPFIFSGNLCAQINIARGIKNGKIIKGPMPISMMFPFFKGTVFEHGVDAAFESTIEDEAYLFKGNLCARINYGSNPPQVLATGLIRDSFPGLKDTIFETSIQAAFASHIEKEAYIFKGDSYGHFHFGSGATDDYLVGGREIKILPDAWSSLRNILPCQNRGLDDLPNFTTTRPGDDDDGFAGRIYGEI